MTTNRCIQCEWLKPESLLETVAIGGDTFYVCDICRNHLAGPGKHQAVAEDDRALCIVLYHLYLNDSLDHWLTDENYGFAGIADRFMLLEDSSGFVEVRTFASADAAMREMNSFEDDGFGASEWDAWISEDRGGYAVSFDGKYVDTYPRLNRAKAKVALLMRDSGYFPNVFLQGERGSVRRIDVRDLPEKVA